MVAPVIAAAGITAAGSIASSMLGKKKNKVAQVPLEPAEVTQARRDLLGIGQSGKYLDLTLGDQYSGPLGNFSMTPIETAGQGRLAAFVNAGRPQIFDSGMGVLNDLLTTDRFDPNNPQGEYAAFQKQADLDLADSITATKRGLAYSGDLFSSDAGRQISNQVLRSNVARQSRLAELADKFVARRLSAIPMAAEMASQQQQLDMMPISAAATYGGKERELQDAEAKASMAEWIRARQEKLGGIDAIRSVLGSAPTYGVPEVSVDTPSPWSKLVGDMTGVASQELIRQMFRGQQPGTAYAMGGPVGTAPADYWKRFQ